MEHMQLAIGRLLLVGILISTIIVICGGELYLYHDSQLIVHYETLTNETARLGFFRGIFIRATQLAPLDLIEFGLMSFVFVQILRVALTAVLFLRIRDFIFFWMSLFILSVLVYSFFWRSTSAVKSIQQQDQREAYYAKN